MNGTNKNVAIHQISESSTDQSLVHVTTINVIQELKLLMWLALPIVFNAIIGQTGLISLYYVGRLNDAKLIGGVTLGNMMCNLTGYSLMIGMCSALDTLLSQAYGSKSYYLLGQYSLLRTVLESTTN